MGTCTTGNACKHNHNHFKGPKNHRRAAVAEEETPPEAQYEEEAVPPEESLDATVAADAKGKGKGKGKGGKGKGKGKGKRGKGKYRQLEVGADLLAAPATLQMYGLERPEEYAYTVEQTKTLRCHKLVDPGWLDPDIFATSAIRVACVAGVKSIYIVGQGVSSTKGPVRFEDHVNVMSSQENGIKIPPSG